MRITIDATATLLRSAGVKNYIYHWVNHVRRLASGGDQVEAFPFLKDFGGLKHAGSTLGVGSTIWRLSLIQMLNFAGRGTLTQAVGRTDIFHASNLLRQVPNDARLTATVYDLTCALTPQFHTRANIQAEASFADRVLRRAHGLIAISENTRRDAIDQLGIAPERITTIYPGIAGEYFTARPAVREKSYVLYVGTIEPRKNLDTLLDAWRILKPGLRNQFELVTAGIRGWSTQQTFTRVRAETTYLGYVPEADLASLMAGATAFVYPSLYEGFGFPVAQALAAGTPVLTANKSCLPEVTGGAALLVDPLSAAELADGLTRLLESEDLRKQLIDRGRERAEFYRWEKSAARSLEFFRQVHGAL